MVGIYRQKRFFLTQNVYTVLVMAAIRLEDRALSQVVPTRLDLATYNHFVSTAKRQRMSKTALARLAIRQYLAHQTSEAPTVAIKA